MDFLAALQKRLVEIFNLNKIGHETPDNDPGPLSGRQKSYSHPLIHSE